MAPVAECHPSRAVDADDVLVELLHFYHDAGLVPFGRVWPRAVLKADTVPDRERWHNLCVLREALMCAHMPVPESFFAVSQRFSPRAVRSVSAKMYRYEVSNWAAEEHLGGR